MYFLLRKTGDCAKPGPALRPVQRDGSENPIVRSAGAFRKIGRSRAAGFNTADEPGASTTRHRRGMSIQSDQWIREQVNSTR